MRTVIVMAFVGNPEAAKKDLIKLIKRLKKEKLHVDIINLGTQEVSTEKLSAFLNTLNGSAGPGSHLLTVPLGPSLAETIISSQILSRKGRTASMSRARDFPFGVDLTGLALTLRVSMEEQRQWQRTEALRPPPAPAAKATPVSRKAQNSDDARLKKTIQRQESGRTQLPDPGSLTKEEPMAHGSQMSPEGSRFGRAKATNSATQDTLKAAVEEVDCDVMQDAEFLQSILENLPGVDAQGKSIRKAEGFLTSEAFLSTMKDKK